MDRRTVETTARRSSGSEASYGATVAAWDYMKNCKEVSEVRSSSYASTEESKRRIVTGVRLQTSRRCTSRSS